MRQFERAHGLLPTTSEETDEREEALAQASQSTREAAVEAHEGEEYPYLRAWRYRQQRSWERSALEAALVPSDWRHIGDDGIPQGLHLGVRLGVIGGQPRKSIPVFISAHSLFSTVDMIANGQQLPFQIGQMIDNDIPDFIDVDAHVIMNQHIA